jgi:F0F1-type ATP synthase membrane subunit b/b'
VKRLSSFGFGRRVVFGVMVCVTAWSLWAWTQQKVAAAEPEQKAVAAKGEGKGGEGEGKEEESGPAPFNWTVFGGETPPFLAMLINFGILAGGYYLLGRKPIAAGLQARRDTISKEIEEAQRMKHEAEERAKVYQVKLEKLEEELQQARDSLVHAGEAESERIVRDAEAKAERMRKEAEFLVGQEFKQIRENLLRETVEAAVAAAEDLLRKRVTPADQERLAEDYLSDLGGRDASGKARPVSVDAPRSVPQPAGSGTGSLS